MSAHTKKPHTEELLEVTVHGDSLMKFLIPRKFLAKLKPYLVKNENEEPIPADIVFKKSYQKYGKVGAAIRGARARYNIMQAQLAKMLNVSKDTISKMEYSKIAIDKHMAQKLAQIFNVNYRIFKTKKNK